MILRIFSLNMSKVTKEVPFFSFSPVYTRKRGRIFLISGLLPINIFYTSKNIAPGDNKSKKQFSIHLIRC